ncbi:MAG TPA: cyclopropane-fatty-acyl-phospholipid synthase family protein [Thermoanaerobaculia bacterium]
MRGLLSRALLLKALRGIRHGRLELRLPGGEVHRFGEPDSELQAVVAVRDERLFSRAVFGGDIGIGEAYVDGLWTSPDLVSLVRLAVRNMDVFDAGDRVPATVSRWVERLRHALRRNSIHGSRQNIRFHYDLGTDFYSLFLDPSLTYSCALFEHPDASLEEAQFAKCDAICRKLELAPGDRLLEIGSGWGALAIHAATRYGARVTTTTISRAQHDYVRERLEREGLSGRIELRLEDYRRLSGRYDKVVSIEMFEAVGLAFYDRYFAAVDRLLAPGGAMLLQTITMNEPRFHAYRRHSDFLRKHIFPGGELASVEEIRRSLARVTRMEVGELEEIGPHYVRTLAAWRERFLANADRVRALGFPESFLRLWVYYLSYCEGGFAEGYIGDAQLLLRKAGAALTRESSPAAAEVASHSA